MTGPPEATRRHGVDAVNRRTIQDLVVAAVIGGALGASPLTSTHLLPSLVIGVAAAAAYFVWRRSQEPGPAAEVQADVSRLPLTIVLALLGTVAVFVPIFPWLYQNWTGSLWSNEHGIFVPPIAAYLAWQALQKDPHPEREESSAKGLVLVVAGLALAVIDSAVGTRYLSLLGLFVLLPGLSMVTLGTRRTRTLAVPFVVSLLMIPVPRTFASDLALRTITAQGVEPIIRFFGYPVHLDLTVLHMPENVFVVANACSGFATAYASVAVAMVLSAYAGSHRERLILLAASIPLAIAANVLRVTVLVLLTVWWGNWVVDSPLHVGSGVATFALVLVSQFGLSSLVRGRHRTTVAEPGGEPS